MAAYEHPRADPTAALRHAEQVCRERGARFTPGRRCVYELLVRAGEPVTAYELLHRMARDGAPPAPPTVYRALEFLQAHGLVHRLASQNRFVACEHPETGAHGGVFLVCDRCGRALEWQDERVARAVARSAREAGFHIDGAVLPEVEGICGHCHEPG